MPLICHGDIMLNTYITAVVQSEYSRSKSGVDVYVVCFGL